MKVNTVRAFLKSREWVENGQNDKFVFMKPPTHLQFDADFQLELPRNENTLTYMRYMKNITEGIADVYNLKKEHLEAIFSKTLDEIKTEIKLTQGMLAYAS